MFNRVRALQVANRLTEPLPETKVMSIEVFDEFVEANVHTHSWICTHRVRVPTLIGIHRLVFECGCGDTEVREISEWDLI